MAAAVPDQRVQAWPPSNGLSTINVPRKDAILTVYASTCINAPAPLVFDKILHIANYGCWNRFCPKVVVHAQELANSEEQLAPDWLHIGTNFTLYAIMNAAEPDSPTPTQLKVTDISTPESPSTYVPQDVLDSDGSFFADLQKVYRVSWKCEGGFVSRGLRTERFHEIIMSGEDRCVVRTWECQGGILARTVKWMYRKTLMEKFQMWVDDLKDHCEHRGKEPQQVQ